MLFLIKNKSFCFALALLLLCFSLTLYNLARFAFHSELYSYILLIPFVSIQLAWGKRDKLINHAEPARAFSIAAALTGMVLLAIYWLIIHPACWEASADRLAVAIGAFLAFLFAACFWFLGKENVRMLAFPLGFLAFMIPFPRCVEDGVVYFLQHGSAVAAALFFKLSGMSIAQDDTSFQLPGFSLQVAPECSGIHSSLVLVITSVVGGYYFLRTPWKRAVFSFAVIPLALLRNGFRVFVIGMLCVHISPEMIDSPIHHRGGPIFFALSLIPLFILLYYLYKSDQPKGLGNFTEGNKGNEGGNGESTNEKLK